MDVCTQAGSKRGDRVLARSPFSPVGTGPAYMR